MNCDTYSVIFSKNKTNGIQAELLKPNFVLNMLVLSYICIVVDVLFHFCEELAYTYYIMLITSESLCYVCNF